MVKYSKNENFFTEPSVLNSYWAGFIAADGCILDKNRLYIGLNKKDISVLEYFLKDTNYSHNIILERTTKRNNTICEHAQISIRCNKWVEDLKTHWNITPRKTKTLLPPNLLNPTHILSYIIGYIDGDGHIGLYDKYIVLDIAGNYNVLNFISNELFKIENSNYSKPLKVTKKQNSNCCYSIKCTHKRATLILEQLNNIKISSKMKRKWNNVDKHLATSA